MMPFSVVHCFFLFFLLIINAIDSAFIDGHGGSSLDLFGLKRIKRTLDNNDQGKSDENFVPFDRFDSMDYNWIFNPPIPSLDFLWNQIEFEEILPTELINEHQFDQIFVASSDAMCGQIWQELIERSDFANRVIVSVSDEKNIALSAVSSSSRQQQYSDEDANYSFDEPSENIIALETNLLPNASPSTFDEPSEIIKATNLLPNASPSTFDEPSEIIKATNLLPNASPSTFDEQQQQRDDNFFRISPPPFAQRQPTQNSEKQSLSDGINRKNKVGKGRLKRKRLNACESSGDRLPKKSEQKANKSEKGKATKNDMQNIDQNIQKIKNIKLFESQKQIGQLIKRCFSVGQSAAESALKAVKVLFLSIKLTALPISMIGHVIREQNTLPECVNCPRLMAYFALTLLKIPPIYPKFSKILQNVKNRNENVEVVEFVEDILNIIQTKSEEISETHPKIRNLQFYSLFYEVLKGFVENYTINGIIKKNQCEKNAQFWRTAKEFVQIYEQIFKNQLKKIGIIGLDAVIAELEKIKEGENVIHCANKIT